jgi:CMP-N,N'-diacetyllegionaminic acid synthase
MIGKYRVLAVIPARAGSKGLPGKNVANLGGRPLVEWTMEAASTSSYVDDVCVTTDDPRVVELAHARGVRVIERPTELASDTAAASAVVLHALDHSPSADVLVYLQPTSPFRTSAHIDAALELLVSGGAACVVTVTPVTERPEWMYRTGPDGILEPAVPQPEARRQDLSDTVLLNGAVYCARCTDLRSVGGRFASLSMRGLVMDRADSVDIDDAADFSAAADELTRRQSRAAE